MSTRHLGTTRQSGEQTRIARLTAFTAALLLVAVSLGCGKAGVGVAKAVGKKVLIEAAGMATTYVGEEVLHQQRQRHEAELRGFQSGQGFGTPSAVQDLRGTNVYQYNAGTQLHLIPNLYGGWNYYTPDGQPVAFSVPQMVYTYVGVQWTGGYLFYDPSGRPIY